MEERREKKACLGYSLAIGNSCPLQVGLLLHAHAHGTILHVTHHLLLVLLLGREVGVHVAEDVLLVFLPHARCMLYTTR